LPQVAAEPAALQVWLEIGTKLKRADSHKKYSSGFRAEWFLMEKVLEAENACQPLESTQVG
jgi:hypothetical protein